MIFGSRNLALRADEQTLMNRDDRAVILLDLFFPQGKSGDEGDGEMFFLATPQVPWNQD